MGIRRYNINKRLESILERVLVYSFISNVKFNFCMMSKLTLRKQSSYFIAHDIE